MIRSSRYTGHSLSIGRASSRRRDVAHQPGAESPKSKPPAAGGIRQAVAGSPISAFDREPTTGASVAERFEPAPRLSRRVTASRADRLATHRSSALAVNEDDLMRHRAGTALRSYRSPSLESIAAVDGTLATPVTLTTPGPRYRSPRPSAGYSNAPD